MIKTGNPLYWGAVAIIVLVVAIYGQTWNFRFLNYDDNEYITDNPYVQQGLNSATVSWAFTSFHSNNWHPMTWIVHILQFQIFKHHAGGHHLMNVVWHIFNALLLMTVLWRMTGSAPPAILCALLFAVHPMHVQSVAWISELKDMMSTLFLLLTLLVYHQFTLHKQSRSPRTPYMYWLAFSLFMIGLLFKPMIVTLPLLLLIIDYWPLARHKITSLKERLIEKIPFFLLSLGSAALTYYAQYRSGAVHTDDYSFIARVFNGLLSMAIYLGKAVWPNPLAVYYPYPKHMDWFLLTFAILVLLIISLLVILQRRQRPFLIAGWLWFLITLIPVIGIVQVGSQSMADRYTYIPYIGLFIMIIWLVEPLRIKKLFYSLSLWVVILLAFTWIAHMETRYWETSRKLFLHALETTTPSALVYNNLALDTLFSGDREKATQYFLSALAINPNHLGTLNNLGLMSLENKQLEKALIFLNHAIQIAPQKGVLYQNLGNVYVETKQVTAAIQAYYTGMKLDPSLILCYHRLGVLLDAQNRPDEALDVYRRGLAIAPLNPILCNDLGLLYGHRGKFDEAIQWFMQALRGSPNFGPARQNLNYAMALKQGMPLPQNPPTRMPERRPQSSQPVNKGGPEFN